MKYTKKILLAIFVWVIFMLLLPILILRIASADAGMGLCFLLFFLLNPILIIFLGIISGTEIRKLWWIPVASAAVFPFFFAIAVQELIVELFFYSAIYLSAGVLSMLGTHLGIKYAKKSRKNLPTKETL